MIRYKIYKGNAMLEEAEDGKWVKYEDHVKEYNNMALKKTDEIIEKQKIIDKMRKEILDKQNELRILLTKKMGTAAE